MTAIAARGEVDFSEAGDGIVLRFRNSDLKRIESKFGTAFFNELMDNALRGTISVEAMEFYLEHGAKKDGKPVKVDADKLDELPVHTVYDKILDGLCLAMRGTTLKEVIEKSIEAFKNQDEDDLPSLQSPVGITSTNSVDGPSGQASE